MSNGSYRFELGDFECVSLSDGSANYPLLNLFANVPRAQIEEALRQRNLPIDYVTTPFTCLSVSTGEHQVLVDMGAGSLRPSTGRLVPNLEAAGLDPGDIDTVIITHAHPGHVGGTLDGEGQLVYANARYFIWKAEWDFWFSELARARAPERFVACARINLEPLQRRVTLLDCDAEIVPGVRAIPAPGHTPGHTVVGVASSDELLLCTGDTVLHPLHLEHPDWTSIYDILPEKAAASKRRIFDLAAEKKALVLGQHFPPCPSLGHVVRSGKGWQWQPTGAAGQAISGAA